MEHRSRQEHSVVFYIVVSLLLAFIIFEIVALILWVPGTWNEQLTAVLAVVSMYGLALGFFSRSAALSDFRDMLEELTSPNIVRYFRGNFIFLTFLLALVSTGFTLRKAPSCPVILLAIKDLLYLALFPILLAYTVFHLFVVATLSYIPMVFASAIVAGFVYPEEDIELSVGIKRILVSSIVKKDQLATKGFLVGIPAFVGSLLSAIGAPFIT